jgi:hypothetical protein
VKIVAYGIKQAMLAMHKAKEEKEKAFAMACVHESEKIMTASLEQVPVDLGNLMGSKFINHRVMKDGVVSTLGYRAEYSLFVHEDPRARHKPGKKYKFLEDPLKAAADGFDQRVADYMKKARG